MAKNLLLISNSFTYGGGYLDHCMEDVMNVLEDKKSILFFPYALKDCDTYLKTVQARFEKAGVSVNSIHHAQNKKMEIQKAEVLFVGGGNTFRLLNKIYQEDLISEITKKVESGTLYIGSSAGSGIAAPTIKTTNDMPIVQPLSFNALNLIPFQINPHYIDPDLHSTHMGETREKRLKEYLEENTIPVVALREGSWLKIQDSEIHLFGKTGGKIFERMKEPYEINQESDLSFLLK